MYYDCRHRAKPLSELRPGDAVLQKLDGKKLDGKKSQSNPAIVLQQCALTSYETQASNWAVYS